MDHHFTHPSSIAPSVNQIDQLAFQPPTTQTQPHMSVAPFDSNEPLYAFDDFSNVTSILPPSHINLSAIEQNPMNPAYYNNMSVPGMSTVSVVHPSYGEGRYRQSADSVSPMSVPQSYSPPFDRSVEHQYRSSISTADVPSPIVMSDSPELDAYMNAANFNISPQVPIQMQTNPQMSAQMMHVQPIYAQHIIDEPVARLPLNTVHEEPLHYAQHAGSSYPNVSPTSNRRVSFPPMVERTIQNIKDMMKNVKKRNVSQTSFDKSVRSSTGSTKYTISIPQNASPTHTMSLNLTNIDDNFHAAPPPVNARIGTSSKKKLKTEEEEEEVEVEVEDEEEEVETETEEVRRKKEKDRAKSKKSAGTMHSELDLMGDFIKVNQEEMLQEGLLSKNEYSKSDRKIGRPKVATLGRSLLKRLWVQRSSSNPNPSPNPKSQPNKPPSSAPVATSPENGSTQDVFDDVEAMEIKEAQLVQELEKLRERIDLAKRKKGTDAQPGEGGHS